MADLSSLDRSAGTFEDISRLAWARGSALAIELLEEADIDENTLDDSARDGRPQKNLLYRYLLRLRQEFGDDPQVEAAFCSVLTDHIATAIEGSSLDAADLEHTARTLGPVAQAVQL